MLRGTGMTAYHDAIKTREPYPSAFAEAVKAEAARAAFDSARA